MKAARIPLVAALLLFAVASGARAEEPLTLDGLNLGEYWYGARVSKKDLLGKVVLVELYGS
jgi:hypothetical protein